MKSVAQDYVPIGRIEDGPPRGRWTDVPAAARAAAVAQELVVIHAKQTGDVWEFRLRSIADRSATMTVTRIDGAQVYRATATVGLFNDDPEAAQELVRSFDDQMRNFARKGRLVVDSQ